MKSIIAGFGLALLAGAALAQTTPTPPPGGPPAPPEALRPGTPRPAAPEGDAAGRPGPEQGGPAGAAASDPHVYQGMIVRTPNGTYMVTEPDEGEDGPAGGPPDRQGPTPPEASYGPDAMTHPMPPRAGMPRPPHPPGPPSRAARFRIHTDDLDLGVTCAADDSTKACVDAIGTLIDKVEAGQRH